MRVTDSVERPRIGPSILYLARNNALFSAETNGARLFRFGPINPRLKTPARSSELIRKVANTNTLLGYDLLGLKRTDWPDCGTYKMF